MVKTTREKIAMYGYRPSSNQNLVLLPKNGGNTLKSTEGATANYGGNTKFGLYPNVGMSYLFQNKIGVGSLFYNTTTPSQVNPPQAASTDGPGISLLPLDASEYVGPEGTFTFTAGTFKIDGVSVKDDHNGFAYLYTFGDPDRYAADATTALSTTNFPFGSVSGNRKILNGQAEIERMVSDVDGTDDNDFFINIYSNQLNEAQLTTALSNLNIEITYPAGYGVTYSISPGDFNGYTQVGEFGDAAPNNGGVWKISLQNSGHPLQDDSTLFVEGQQYSVVVTT